MPSVVRLSRNQLIEWIESKEAGGGDATELRRVLEALGPDQDSRTRPRRHGSRFNNEEEPTLAERLNNRVGDLFTNGINDEVLTKLMDIDYKYSLKELRTMCVEAGLGTRGDKKEMAAKLVAKGIL